MKHLNKIVCVLVMLIALCMTMTPIANATETGNLWLSVVPADNGEDTTALIVTDTTVTDGLVKLTYDPEKLTYKDVLVSSAYVAVHSVNAEQPGVLLISWIAPEAYTAGEDPITLIRINFAGTDAASLEATGDAHGTNGAKLALGTLVTDALLQAIRNAEAMKAGDYTQDSWTELE